MPFLDKFFSIIVTRIYRLFHHLLFNSMVINNSNRRTELYLSLFPSIRYMYMNGLMLIHIEEKTYSKNYKQCRHLFFCKDRYNILYLQVIQHFSA